MENMTSTKYSVSASPPLAHAEHLRQQSDADRYSNGHTSSTIPLQSHGVGIDHKIPQAGAVPQNPDLAWPRTRSWLKEYLSEFWGTFIFILFGCGCVAQVTLANGSKGDYQSISWGWGLGLMLGVYVAGVSGGHLNPAVTFTNCVLRGFPWRKFPAYMLAQTLGAMCAAAVVYGNYKHSINVYEGGSNVRTVPGYSTHATAGIFATYPTSGLPKSTQFFSEFIASAILMFMIYALQDNGNLGAGNLVPLGLFFVIFGISACFGWETGFAINFARDFGPRLVTYMIGYGHHVWSAAGYYFWIPMVAPFLGCLFGGWLYDMNLYTGASPVNTPWAGFKRFLSPTKSTWSNTYNAGQSGREVIANRV